MGNDEILLKVEHLCQYFRAGRKEFKAVDDISFEVKRGEVFGLVGESGCGKTTTGRAIVKLYDITSGNIYFKGKRVGAGTRSYEKMIESARKETREKIKLLRSKSGENSAEISALRARMREVISQQKQSIGEARRDNRRVGTEKRNLITQIQMIFQDPIASLDPRMTVRDIIAEGLVISGIRDQAYINEKVYEILEVVGLVREHADRYPHEFSGGQRQRIGIARAVIMQPEMIIADEPISALDVSVQAQVINLLNDLRARFGLTILFIAHDLSVVKYFSDRIGVMYCGKLVEIASSEELFHRPLHPYTKSLLSAIPLPDPHYEKKRIRKTYNPLAEHDYSMCLPSMREIAPEHFVYCNDEEEERYKRQC